MSPSKNPHMAQPQDTQEPIMGDLIIEHHYLDVIEEQKRGDPPHTTLID